MEAKDCFRDLVARDSAHQFSSRKKKRKNPKSNSKIIFKFFSIAVAFTEAPKFPSCIHDRPGSHNGSRHL